MEVIVRADVLNGVKDPVGYQQVLTNMAAEKPLKDWEQEMRETDHKMPRCVEDVIDALDDATRNKIAKKTMDDYNDKKAKRARKP